MKTALVLALALAGCDGGGGGSDPVAAPIAPPAKPPVEHYRDKPVLLRITNNTGTLSYLGFECINDGSHSGQYDGKWKDVVWAEGELTSFPEYSVMDFYLSGGGNNGEGIYRLAGVYMGNKVAFCVWPINVVGDDEGIFELNVRPQVHDGDGVTVGDCPSDESDD
jgi:hypothetical protein